MRVVQALHWLQDMLPGDAARVKKRLASIFTDPRHGPAIVADLRDGLSTLPIWMQAFLRDLIGETPDRLADAGDDGVSRRSLSGSLARATSNLW
jgi:hypothetical protein